MTQFAFYNNEPDSCEAIHARIKGYVEVAFERYLNGLQNPQPYECGCCHKQFMRPEDFDNDK